MFFTAISIAKSEKFILQKHDILMFFAGYTSNGEPQWVSDQTKGKQFKSITDLISEAKNLNLDNVLAIRNMFQVVDIQIEHPLVEET